MSRSQRQTLDLLLERHGRTYAEEAGIRVRDKPSPLYRLLVLANLLAARIDAEIAVAASVELSRAGMRTPRRMLDATWQQRVDALGRGRYRRYDERTATMLGDGAGLLLRTWRGDLRRLCDDADDREGVLDRLQEMPGVGPAGAAIFVREVQASGRRSPPSSTSCRSTGPSASACPATRTRSPGSSTPRTSRGSPPHSCGWR